MHRQLRTANASVRTETMTFAYIGVRERFITVDCDSDTDGEELCPASSSDSVTVPVKKHRAFHGAGLHPGIYSGPFLQPPSEDQIRHVVHARKETLQIPKKRVDGHRHDYSPRTPWCKDTIVAARPATAGREHEQPTWWASDARGEQRWTTPAAGTHKTERPRWAHNEHILQAGYSRKAEIMRGKKRAVQYMPAFLKVRNPPPGPPAAEWKPPQVPPPVNNPEAGKVQKLSEVRGKKWALCGYQNLNYKGKGVYIARLQQDRLGNAMEWL